MQVYTEGRLIVDFTFDDMMRIRSWHFSVRSHRELIPRSVLAMQEPAMMESLSKNVTRQGLTSTTLNYLRVSEAKWIFMKITQTASKTNLGIDILSFQTPKNWYLLMKARFVF